MFDAAHDRLVVFGGLAGRTTTSEVWSLAVSDETPAWMAMAVAGGPAGRADHASIYDPIGVRMIVFGGYSRDSLSSRRVPLDDTWALSLEDNPAWSRIGSPGPSSRYLARAIYDPIGRKMILFGGATESAFYRDVWALDLVHETWSPLSFSGEAPAGLGKVAYYDDAAHSFALLGGSEISRLDLGSSATWLREPVATANDYGVVVYDPFRHRFLTMSDESGSAAHAWELVLDRTTPVSAEWLSLRYARGRVEGELLIPGTSIRFVVERRSDTEAWRRVDVQRTDGSGRLRFGDSDVRPGGRYFYRVGSEDGSAIGGLPERAVVIPAQTSLASMIVRPNPIADDRITVSWEEGLAGNLRLELFDLAGRRLAKWSADPFIEREWSVHLSTALAPGIYLLRINRSDEMESRRLVVTR